MATEFIAFGAQGINDGVDTAIALSDANDAVWKIKADSATKGFKFNKDNVNFATFGGTSTAPVVDDTANVKFNSWYFDSGATSGDCTGVYTRTYITGAGGGGNAFRSFATVSDVAAATVRGAHISLSFGTSGTVTGLGCALEATLHMPSTAGMAGTNYAIKAAINSDGANADPAGATTIGFIGIVSQGTQGGLDDLDTDGVIFDFQGLTAASGVTKILSSTSLNELPANSVGVRCKIGSTLYYLPLVLATEWN